MVNKVIEQALKAISQIGCDRVVTTHDGRAVPYKNAVEEFDIDVEIIFIRDDGWTLGCNRNMLETAYYLWHDKWIAVLIKPNAEPILFQDFATLGQQKMLDLLPKEINTSKKIP